LIFKIVNYLFYKSQLLGIPSTLSSRKTSNWNSWSSYQNNWRQFKS